MRIIHHGEFTKPSSYERWVDRALQEAGCLTYTIQEDTPGFSLDVVDRVMGEIKQADVFLCHKPVGMHEDHARYLKKRYRLKLVMWTPDYRRQPAWDWYESLARVFDLTLATDGDEECAQWELSGINTQTLRQACDPRIHYPMLGVEPTYDVGFFGSLYTSFRHQMHETFRQEFGGKFLYRGSGHDTLGEAWGDDFRQAVASCKIVVGSNYLYVPGYWSDRVYLTTACGGFFLAPEDVSLREEFGDTLGYYNVNDLPHLLGQIRYWLELDVLRQQSASRARKIAHEKHAYTHRIQRLLEAVKGLR